MISIPQIVHHEETLTPHSSQFEPYVKKLLAELHRKDCKSLTLIRLIEITSQAIVLHWSEAPGYWLFETLSEWWSASATDSKLQMHWYFEAIAPTYDKKNIPTLRRIYS